MTDYTPIIEGDRYCVMCRHACPVERVTKREANSPHGWALLVASVGRGLLQWEAEPVDTLYQCADCGLCQANCATDRPLPAALVAARAGVVAEGAHPATVSDVDSRLRQWGNPYGPGPEVDLPPDMTPSTQRIGLFVGAGSQQHRPQAVAAARALLRAAGDDPWLLSAGRSGVYLPYTLGLWDTARQIAADTLAEIAAAGVTHILTLSKEDAHAFHHLYPELGIALPDGLEIEEFTLWLGAQIADGRLRVRAQDRGRVVYHDPSHTPRLMQTGSPARQIVTALTGTPPGELFWRGKGAAPSGVVGGFPFTQPALAARLSQARIADARRAGADWLVTDDPQDAAHLAAHADGLPVTTLVEWAAEQLET